MEKTRWPSGVGACREGRSRRSGTLLLIGLLAALLVLVLNPLPRPAYGQVEGAVCDILPPGETDPSVPAASTWGVLGLLAIVGVLGVASLRTQIGPRASLCVAAALMAGFGATVDVVPAGATSHRLCCNVTLRLLQVTVTTESDLDNTGNKKDRWRITTLQTVPNIPITKAVLPPTDNDVYKSNTTFAIPAADQVVASGPDRFDLKSGSYRNRAGNSLVRASVTEEDRGTVDTGDGPVPLSDSGTGSFDNNALTCATSGATTTFGHPVTITESANPGDPAKAFSFENQTFQVTLEYQWSTVKV